MEILKTLFSVIFMFVFPSACSIAIFVFIKLLLSACLKDRFRWRAWLREGSDFILKILVVVAWILLFYIGIYLLEPELFNEIMLSAKV